MSRSLAADAPAPRAPAFAWRSARALAIGVALLGAMALAVQRLWLAAVQPLWFDEAWSLMVATTPGWGGVIHAALTDVNAPLGYFLLHAWTSLAGPSDLALRLPGLAAVAVAAAIPLMRRVDGLGLETRLAWAVMLFSWWGVDVFLAGRAYGLLLALSTLQCLLFADLVRAPGRRAAFAWASVATLAILTHYYALIGVAVQGLLYLATGRNGAMRSCADSFGFVPAAGWIAWHAPRLAQFAGADVAWHAAIGPAAALSMAGFLLDPSAPALGLLAAAAAGLGFLLSRDRTQAQPRHLWIAAAAALIALAVTLATGAWRPSLTARYLIPTAPGLLLGLGLCAKGGARPRLAAAALALAWLTAALWPGPFAAGLKRQSPYGFETASNILMRQDVGDVVFAWDHETARIMPAATLESLGETFFRRAGFPARVHALAIQPGDDVNALAIAAATGPRPGLIWIYNRAGRTAAALHPPRLPALDARWRCRRIGDETVGSLACWRD